MLNVMIFIKLGGTFPLLVMSPHSNDLDYFFILKNPVYDSTLSIHSA